jgi:hypothetical protein
MSLQVVSVWCLILWMDQALSIQTSLLGLFLEYGWGNKLRRIAGRDEVASAMGIYGPCTIMPLPLVVSQAPTNFFCWMMVCKLWLFFKVELVCGIVFA